MKKTKWFVIENTWLRRELSESLKLDFGWGNGYVAVHRSHPLFGKEYNKPIHLYGKKLEYLIDVHGGITFSNTDGKTNLNRITVDEKGNEVPYIKKNPKDWWVFGFDTAHFQDNANNWTKQAVIKELNEKRKNNEKT